MDPRRGGDEGNPLGAAIRPRQLRTAPSHDPISTGRTRSANAGRTCPSNQARSKAARGGSRGPTNRRPVAISRTVMKDRNRPAVGTPFAQAVTFLSARWVVRS